jgi:benzaldehyde dehydrogenase (NAD)
MRFDRLNPMTNEVASSALAMTVAEARAVAERAGAAFPGWAALGPNARRAVLSKPASALEGRSKPSILHRHDVQLARTSS